MNILLAKKDGGWYTYFILAWVLCTWDRERRKVHVIQLMTSRCSKWHPCLWCLSTYRGIRGINTVLLILKLQEVRSLKVLFWSTRPDPRLTRSRSLSSPSTSFWRTLKKADWMLLVRDAAFTVRAPWPVVVHMTFLRVLISLPQALRRERKASTI